MTTLLDATNELTKPWNEILTPEQTGDGYQIIDHQPRITMLREAIASSGGGTTSGRSLASTRNLINLAAFDLWQRIDEQTRSALNEHSIKPEPELIDALDQLGTRLDALRNTNNIREEIHSKIIARVHSWLGSIENLFDPPTRKEIKGACPEPDCGASRVTVDGSEGWALFAYYWKGHAPAARCQACGKQWQGERELLELGFSLNANMDHDALADLGIETRAERMTAV